MGLDRIRFVEENISQEFICGICHGVLEEPLMTSDCQHLFCQKCIRDCLKQQAICPLDRTKISLSRLEEPVRIIKNLLKQLKIKCDFESEGCKQVINLGELETHCKNCEFNPEIKKMFKCLCEQEFKRTEFDAHKENCLAFMKNELAICKSLLTTISSNLYTFNENLIHAVASDSVTRFLYNRLKPTLPETTNQYNKIQEILLYIIWKLLINEKNNGSKSTKSYIKYAVEDLSVATANSYEDLRLFIELNGFDYIFHIKTLFNGNSLNKHISQILKNFCDFDPLVKELMNKQCIDLLVKLLELENNEFYTNINCATILSIISLKGLKNWNKLMPDFDRQNMLNNLKTNVSKWKLNVNSEITYTSLKDLFVLLKSDQMVPEVQYFGVWLLAYLTRIDCKKYVPMFESENGIEILKTISDNKDTESSVKRISNLVLYQCDTFKKLGHLNGLENSEEMDVTKINL
jgi:hypothetical protein